MKKLFIQLLSPRSLRSPNDGKAILTSYASKLAGLVPDRVNNCEPINNHVCKPDLSDALPFWKWPFLARRTKPRVYFSVWPHLPHKRPQHSDLTFECTADAIDYNQAFEFLRDLVRVTEADFAMLEVLGDDYIDYGRSTGTVSYLNVKRTSWTFGITTHLLRRGLPDVFGITFFGQPYVELFGRDRLINAPVASVEAASENGFFLKLTNAENLSESAQRETKEQLKVYLGKNAFLKDEKTEASMLPIFSFRE